jgi:hypothetical protein
VSAATVGVLVVAGADVRAVVLGDLPHSRWDRHVAENVVGDVPRAEGAAVGAGVAVAVLFLDAPVAGDKLPGAQVAGLEIVGEQNRGALCASDGE